MKRLLWIGSVLVLTSPGLLANPDFTKKTAKKCFYCHEGNWTSGKYTEAGQYYKEHGTLKGFVPKPQAPPQTGSTQAPSKDKRL